MYFIIIFFQFNLRYLKKIFLKFLLNALKSTKLRTFFTRTEMALRNNSTNIRGLPGLLNGYVKPVITRICKTTESVHMHNTIIDILSSAFFELTPDVALLSFLETATDEASTACVVIWLAVEPWLRLSTAVVATRAHPEAWLRPMSSSCQSKPSRSKSRQC